MAHTRVMVVGIALCLVVGSTSQALAQEVANGRETGTPAQTIIDQAVKDAKASKKPVLVYFRGGGARKYGQQIDDFIQSSDVSKLLSDNYVIARLVWKMYQITKADSAAAPDANPGTARFQNSLPKVEKAVDGRDAVRNSPLIAVLDSTGTAIAGVSGDALPSPEDFDALLEQTAPRISAADRKRITDYLKQQAQVKQ